MLFTPQPADVPRRRCGTIPSFDRFRIELEREILRSERSDIPLTLLLLDVRRHDRAGVQCPEGIELLARTLAECTRKCDSLGWYRQENGLRIGLLLFNTRPSRVERIMEKIRDNFLDRVKRALSVPSGVYDIHYDVFTYPSENLPPFDRDENGDGNGFGNGNGHGNGNGNGNSNAKANGGSNGNGNGVAHDTRNGNGTARAVQTNGQQAVIALMSQIQDERSGEKEQPRPVPSAGVLNARPLPVWKRTLDVVGAGLGVIFLSPLLMLIAVCIKLSSKGPVFFRQERVGHSGRPFPCLKFRSMKTNFDQEIHRQHMEALIDGCESDKDGAPAMEKLDGRNQAITWIGRIIRPTHMDELAQLFNVLRGEMSLVGPRPCIPYEAKKYQHWCHRRFDAYPGITGLWQVKGKNRISFHNMIRLDIIYTRRQSLWLDLSILFLTIPTIIQDVIAALGLSRIKEGVQS
jgi:lipopolysaccharide/colanic/teichoic acid biosynthesis glycosyltransferase